MDFDFSGEQTLLRDAVTRLMGHRYGFEARKTYAASPDGWSREIWAQYTELGLLGLTIPESYDGFGLGPVETMIVMEAIGGTLALEPYLSTVVLCGGLIRHGGSEAQKAVLLPKIVAGASLIALAQTEPQSRYNLADVATAALRSGQGYVLNGVKSLVLHGDSAELLIVVARVAGRQHDPDGIGLFLVSARAHGVTLRGYPMQDGHRGAEVTLAGVEVGPDAVLGDAAGALALLERVQDEAIAALCAEAVGAMAAAQNLTVEYLKIRKQFGAAIGAFQALQHRAADMYLMLEQARSMALFATMMVESPDPAARRRAMRAAKIQIGRSGRFIAQNAVQLHGGIGVTMDYAIGHYFKRLTMIDTMFGDADHQLGLLAREGEGLLD